MTTFQVRISVFPVPLGFMFDGRGFIDGTDKLLRKTCGGLCVGVANDGRITLEARADSRERIASLIEAYCAHFRTAHRQVEVVIVEAPKTSLSEGELEAGTRLNAAPVKLTKSLFMKQATGAFLASNAMGCGFEPIFAELIEALDARGAQWERIREAGADQRACHLFPSQAHFRQWQDEALKFFRSRA